MTFNKFFNCETIAGFNSALESGTIEDPCIVFIEETKQIWTHGQFYSCPYTREEIDNLFNSSGSTITKADVERVLTGNITSHTHSYLPLTGTAANASKVANSLTLKINSGTTEGTNQYIYNGSSAKSLDIKAGSNVTLTASSGALTISSTNTTYGLASSTSNGLMSKKDKVKLDGVEAGAQVNDVTSVAGRTGAVVLTKSDVGLGNVTNESKATMFTNASLTGTPTAPTASSSTNSTQIATTAFVQSLVNSKTAASDAMIYKGTIGSSGATITSLPDTTAKTGWTYKVLTAGTYAGQKCEVGDMIICLTDGSTSTAATWTVIQTNIDGAVTGPSSSVDSHVVTFNGSTGKIVKDSGFTIGKSVPSNAVFTDTHYTTNIYAGSGTAANASTTNGNTKVTIADNTTVRGSVTIKGTGATTVTSDASGVVTINSTNTTYGVASTTANGLMSSSDKSKLDGIASGANKTTVDSALSSTSTNPVQNKIIKAELDTKMDIEPIVLTNQDLDDVMTTGLYAAGGGNSVTNKPDGLDAFGLKVYKTASSIVVQELTAGNIQQLSKYTRQYRYISESDGNEWDEWKVSTSIFSSTPVANQVVVAADSRGILKTSGFTIGKSVPSNAVFTDTHYTTNIYAGSGTAANASTTNGNTKVTIADNTTVRGSVTIKGTGATTVTSDASGVVTINSTNTTYGVASTTANGLMSSSDKSKLDGIASGANKTTVDSALSSTSTNPVQNKIIKAELDTKMDIEPIVLTNQDLDDVMTTGLYAAGGGNSVTNKPDGLDAFGLKVYKTASSIVVQELTAGNIQQLSKYTRQYRYISESDGNEWDEWKVSTSIFSSTPVANQVVVAADSRGILKTSGFTIAKSVPSDAKFTDTIYTLPTASSSVLGGVKIGSNITLSSGVISLTKDNVTSALGYTPPTSNTTYSAGTGLTLTGTSFSLSNSGVTAGSYGPTANVSGSNGTTINVPQITVDAMGRVTSVTNRVYTSVDNNTVYTHPTSSGNKHIPSGGSSGQILRWSADGTAAWGNDNNTTYGIANNTTNGLIRPWYNHTAASTGPTAGSNATAVAVNGISTTAGRYYALEMDSNGRGFVNVPWTDNNTTYSVVGANGSTGLVKNGSSVTSASGYTACPIISGVPYYKDTNTTYTLSSFGITATAAELNYCDGVTSNIQTQLNAKAASSHTHSYLPLSGGTMTGNITYSGKGTCYIGPGDSDAANSVGGALGNLVISSWQGVSFTTSCTGMTYTGKTAVSINCRTGQVYAAGFTGPLAGNSSTSTKLATARTINGTSFDGSANITTANWGTARTITIGSTGKSVNGSGNVSWSLSEIGAAAASHSHNYVSLISGGYITQYNNYEWIDFFHIVINSRSNVLSPYVILELTRTETGSDMYGRLIVRIRRNSDNTASFSLQTVNLGSSKLPTIKMTTDDGVTWKLWMRCVKASYDPYIKVKLTEYGDINSYSYQSVGTTSTPTGTKYNIESNTNTVYANYSNSAGYVSRDRGQNTVTTLASLPITKSTVIANLSAATSISLAANMNVGESITVICTPSASFTQPIPTSGSFISMDGSSLSVTSGKKFEINIYCYNTNVYSISCKVAK